MLSWPCNFVYFQVILRLGSGSPQLYQCIHTLKMSSLDPAKEKEYQTAVTEWEKLDENIRQDIDAMKKNISYHGTSIANLEEKHEQNTSGLENLKLLSEKNAEKLTNFEKAQNDIVEWFTRHREDHLGIVSFVSRCCLK